MVDRQAEAPWAKWLDEPDLKHSRDSIVVTIAGPHGSPDARRHEVRVAQQAETLVLSAVVARSGQLPDPSEVAGRLWLSNRAHRLASFRIDRDGAIVATCVVPVVDLDAEEFCFIVRHLAREADRMEFELTGRDRH